jgi:hypothetical protein
MVEWDLELRERKGKVELRVGGGKSGEEGRESRRTAERAT